MNKRLTYLLRSAAAVCLLPCMVACGGARKSADMAATAAQPVGPAFSADSAYQFCQQQCDFGPRTMNSEAHERCAAWIAGKFRQYGLEVSLQQATLSGYDGTPLRATNIMASYQPAASRRVLLCAHWDSRPWADNDPDEANHRQPVMAANDGASGVAVMIELARLISADTLNVGVDFVCFDAEDWGVPEWADFSGDHGSTWALGAQHWAGQFAASHSPSADRQAPPAPQYGILLDMVGGQGARFFQEQVSMAFARSVVEKVWRAAEVVGYGGYFVRDEGGGITDDHLPVNQVAKIPCIDIIPYYPDCEQSTFGPTWHTVSDDMQHIDRATLQAVGQTLVQVLYSE